jgi:hypothetical protein
LRDESDATTHRTPKALRAKFMADAFAFRESFGSAHASSRRFCSITSMSQIYWKLNSKWIRLGQFAFFPNAGSLQRFNCLRDFANEFGSIIADPFGFARA